MSPKKEKNNKQKIIWLWTCVGLVMAAIVFFWAMTIPNRLKLDGSSDITTRLFKENKDKLSTLFEENKKTVEFLSASPEIYNKLSATLASASSTLGLTPEQIQNLKDKINH